MEIDRIWWYIIGLATGFLLNELLRFGVSYVEKRKVLKQLNKLMEEGDRWNARLLKIQQESIPQCRYCGQRHKSQYCYITFT